MTAGLRDAEAAVERADVAWALLVAQRPEAREHARRWKAIREENHFAQLIRDVVLGGEGR